MSLLHVCARRSGVFPTPGRGAPGERLAQPINLKRDKQRAQLGI